MSVVRRVLSSSSKPLIIRQRTERDGAAAFPDRLSAALYFFCPINWRLCLSHAQKTCLRSLRSKTSTISLHLPIRRNALSIRRRGRPHDFGSLFFAPPSVASFVQHLSVSCILLWPSASVRRSVVPSLASPIMMCEFFASIFNLSLSLSNVVQVGIESGT